jgi:hypothetical protein
MKGMMESEFTFFLGWSKQQLLSLAMKASVVKITVHGSSLLPAAD